MNWKQRYSYEKTSGIVQDLHNTGVDIFQLGKDVFHGVGHALQSFNPIHKNPISPEFEQLLRHKDLVLQGLSNTPLDVINSRIRDYAEMNPGSIGGHSISLPTVGKDALLLSTPYLPGAINKAYEVNKKTPPKIVQKLDNATKRLPGRSKK